MCIFPATLEIMRGEGHSWEGDDALILVVSMRGSKAFSLSGEALLGRSTYTNSSDLMFRGVGGETSTNTRRTEEPIAACSREPYLQMEPSQKNMTIWRLGRLRCH